jgi:hypothetical protein
MNKLVAKISLIALVSLFIMPAPAKADFTYSRSQTGLLVFNPISFTVSLDNVSDLNCNPNEDDYWYVGTYDTVSGIAYYPSVDQIRPTTDLSDSFTIDMPTGAAITHVWTACLTSDANFDTENGGLILEQDEVFATPVFVVIDL